MINQLGVTLDSYKQSPKVFQDNGKALMNVKLPAFINEVNATADDISNKHSEITTIGNDVDTKHSEVTTMKDDVLIAKQDVDDKTAQFDTTVSNSLTQIDTYTTDKETQLETFKDEKIAQIQAEASDTSNVVMHFKMKSFGLEL